MTKEEAAQLNELARQLERNTGATQEALRHTRERLDRIDANTDLIRKEQESQGKTLAGMQVLCQQRGKRISGLERCIREKDGTGPTPPYDEDATTPPPFDVSQVAGQEPRRNGWTWVRERVSTILAVGMLLGVIGGAVYWMVGTYQTIETMKRAVVGATDGGKKPGN
jgi:hypothetical protein